jgi:hypothetical protein
MTIPLLMRSCLGRTGRFLPAVACAVWLCTTVASRAGAQGMPASLAQFLQQTAGLSSDEIKTAAAGIPVVKSLKVSDPREIAMLGVVSINVPRSFYVQRVTDFASSLHQASRTGLGIFSDPAVASDVAAVSLSQDDVKNLANCRPGDCKLKLPAQSITQLRASIDLKSPQADSVATAYVHARMVDYVTAYRARGDAALVTYDDSKDTTAAVQVWDAMLSQTPYIYQYAPELDQYLKNYPNDRPPGVREAIYWALDDLSGGQPTLTVNDEIVSESPARPHATYVMSKQLFSDHYLDGGLDLTAILDQSSDSATASASASAGATPGIYVVMLRRLHFDNLPSGGLLNIRGRVIGKLTDVTKTLLGDAKTQSEHDYAGRPASSH